MAVERSTRSPLDEERHRSEELLARVSARKRAIGALPGISEEKTAAILEPTEEERTAPLFPEGGIPQSAFDLSSRPEFQIKEKGWKGIAALLKKATNVLLGKEELPPSLKEAKEKASGYLEAKLQAADNAAQEKGIENPFLKKLYTCWKTLGDVNLSDLKDDEWKQKHQVQTAVLRFCSARTVASLSLLGVGTLGVSAGNLAVGLVAGAAEALRGGARATGAGVLAHDFLTAQESARLSALLDVLEGRRDTPTSPEAQKALEKKLINASALYAMRKKGYSPAEQHVLEERFARVQEYLTARDTDVEKKLASHKLWHKLTVGITAVAAFFGPQIIHGLAAGSREAGEATYAMMHPDAPPITAETPEDVVHREHLFIQTYRGLNPEHSDFPPVRLPFLSDVQKETLLETEPPAFDAGLGFSKTAVDDYLEIKARWTPFVDTLAERIQLMGPDMPGHQPASPTPQEYMNLLRLKSIDPLALSELGEKVESVRKIIAPNLEKLGIHDTTFDGKNTLYETLKKMHMRDPNVFGGEKPGRVLLRWLDHAGIKPGEGGMPSLVALREQFTLPKGTTMYFSNQSGAVIEIRENIRPIKSVLQGLIKKAS